MPDHSISKHELTNAIESFRNVPIRRLFYTIASDLIESTLAGQKPFTTAEALSVLLENWNRVHYKKDHFDQKHFEEIKRLLQVHNWQVFRSRQITELTDNDRAAVRLIYLDFEEVLGSVGASKALHLLAPGFFPIWIPSTAKAYGLELTVGGDKFDKYWDLMKVSKEQCHQLLQMIPDLADPLLILHEHNYFKYAKQRQLK